MGASHLLAQQLTEASLTPKHNLGDVAVDAFGRRFRYVKSASVLVKGDVVGISSTATTSGAHGYGWRVSSAASATASKMGAGVAIANLSSSQYGFILSGGPLGNFGGLNLYAKTDKGIVAGDLCIKDEATAKMLDTHARTLYGSQDAWIIARAIGSDSGSFLAAGIVIDRWGT